MIRYLGTHKNPDGATVYVFLVNGLQKEVREGALKQHPGCYEALPASAKAKIAANRQWLHYDTRTPLPLPIRRTGPSRRTGYLGIGQPWIAFRARELGSHEVDKGTRFP